MPERTLNAKTRHAPVIDAADSVERRGLIVHVPIVGVTSRHVWFAAAQVPGTPDHHADASTRVEWYAPSRRNLDKDPAMRGHHSWHGDLLSPQRYLHHVTWLKLRIFLRGEAFPAVLALSDDGNLGLAARSTYKL